MPAIDDPNVLVATATNDDAGVYRISDDLALVQTVDFFTPIVDDPRTFGRIAAANAFSDIYAMGARPLTALAIAAFPDVGLSLDVLGEILAGGAEKAREANVSIIGGHTVKDPEPKYGLAVTGCVHPEKIVRNSSARPGDVLVLTKPLGTGILTTARRQDAISDDELAPAITAMETLNKAASEAMLEIGVHAATDISGYGLVGHLMEMCGGSGVGADVDANAVPLFDEAVALANAGHVPGGTLSNYRFALTRGVRFADALSEPIRFALCDAQTSGGLLISAGERQAEALLAALRRANAGDAAIVGTISTGQEIVIR